MQPKAYRTTIAKDGSTAATRIGHDIAHGTEIDNSAGHSIIGSDKVKIEILIFAFTAFICAMTNPVSPLIVTEPEISV